MIVFIIVPYTFSAVLYSTIQLQYFVFRAPPQGEAQRGKREGGGRWADFEKCSVFSPGF